MKKLTDPQKIAEINTSIRKFWKNIQFEIATGNPKAVASSNFWKDYCGIDFTIDFDALNPQVRYSEIGWCHVCAMYFTVGKNSFRYTQYGLTLIRKRNPYISLDMHYSKQNTALLYFHRELAKYTRDIELLKEMDKYVIR